MAAASYAGRNVGQMKPPSCEAAKSTAPLPATSIRCDGRELRPRDRRAVALAEALRLAAHRDRQRDARARVVARRRASRARAAPAPAASGDALVVDDRRGLAVGIEDVAEVGARGAHEVADRP